MKSGSQSTGGPHGIFVPVSLSFHGKELSPHAGIPNSTALISNRIGLLRSLFKMVIFGLEYFGTLAVSLVSRLINWPLHDAALTRKLAPC